ncbi:hypothetical protein BKA66DRAFT_447366 [Pyrenochaeta sp. MPI-SDFR-AT-0127]|nr:hypothetical protein BKA66DRAFT_447366 [Pyrenochaeta sp. MPI-SDFR-AT-0127]
MLKTFEQLVKGIKSRSSKTQRALNATSRLADKLGPYFEVVNIYVQSHPEYAALVWGTLRFILLLATNYTTFLAKIELMLSRMMNTMPDFERFLDQIRRSDLAAAEGVIPRLGQALAWIYGDILTFCHRIKSRWKRFNNMAFKPFNTHFAEIIENFEIHSELFRDLRDTTSAVVALESCDRWKSHMTNVQLSLDQMHDQLQSLEKDNKVNLSAAIAELQRRVGAPVWANTFENARSHRLDESGEWLLAHPLMTALIEHNSAATSKHANVLFLYGKPGYGKTTLATVVIDHLKDTASLRGQTGPDSLAFFFFDKQSRYNSSQDAFRALLAQLIFSRRFDQIVLDIAALARPAHDAGHELASDDEVFAILHLFLLQFSTCSFVCDGVDECADRNDFLAKMTRLASDHEECRFLLFSRPIIKVPKELQKRANFLEMDHTQNIEDLTNFVYPQIEELVDGGELVLVGVTSVEDVASSICSRSNGMFLWATLFLGYLKLPSLSISQRRAALEDSHRFEGLFSLYDGILEFIEKEYPKLSRRNIRRAISWVLGAFRPLQVDELLAAIAQMDDRPFDEADCIPNFENAIGPMTGALIEITRDKTVRLIHNTVAEYLVSTSETIAPSFCDETILDFKEAVVQNYLTTICLAYMTYTVPIGPYADRYRCDCNFASKLKEYPLFGYAAQYWTSHLRESTGKFATYSHDDSLGILKNLGERAFSFLSNKLHFTSWTEALWHMGCPKEAWAMQSVEWGNSQSISALNKVRKAASLLNVAFKEHEGLVKYWGNVLQKNPEEIWQPSISAFSQSQLRKTSTAAEISSILCDSTKDRDLIVLQTKCSSSGHAIGILYAQYRSNVSPYMYRSEAPTNFSPLTVTYEIRSLNDDQLLFQTTVDVPAKDVSMNTPDPSLGLCLQRSDSFCIETSISSTLMELMVGSTLIKLATRIDASGPQFHCTKHALTFLVDNSGFKRPQLLQSLWKLFLSPGAEYLLLLRQYRQRNTRRSGHRLQNGEEFIIDIFQDPMCRRSPLKPKFVWVAWKTLDASSVSKITLNALTNISNPTTAVHDPVIQREDDFNSLHTQSRSEVSNLNLGQDQPEVFDTGPHKPPSPLKGAKGLHNDEVLYEPQLLFHPTLPQIIYSYGRGTYLWNFCSLLHSTVHDIYQEHVKIHHVALRNVRIADSGKLLYGFERFHRKDRVVIINLAPYQDINGKPRTVLAHSKILDSSKSVVQHFGNLTRDDLLREASAQAQPSGSAMLVLDASGSPALSILRQPTKDGSLVQETFDSQGNTKTRSILHLPSSISGNTDITLLNPGESSGQQKSKHIKALLGVPPKNAYSFKQSDSAATAEKSLPTIFQRTKDSIRTIEGGVEYLSGHASAPLRQTTKKVRVIEHT